MTTTEDQEAAPRLRVWLENAAEDGRTLPEAITNPQTPAQIWAYARRGAWTTRGVDSPVRWPATAWACFAVAVAVPADFIKWAVQRPARFATVAVSTVLIGTALAQVPVVGAIVPDLINVTSWWH